jgi:hypothetical protein
MACPSIERNEKSTAGKVDDTAAAVASGVKVTGESANRIEMVAAIKDLRLLENIIFSFFVFLGLLRLSRAKA